MNTYPHGAVTQPDAATPTIDIRSEELFTLSELARQLPRRRGRRPVSPSTLYRWWRRGLRGVHLEVLQVGGTACSSREAMQRFFERLGRVAGDGAPHVATPRQVAAPGGGKTA